MYEARWKVAKIDAMDMDSDVSNLNITICYYGYAFLLLHVQNVNYFLFWFKKWELLVKFRGFIQEWN